MHPQPDNYISSIAWSNYSSKDALGHGKDKKYNHLIYKKFTDNILARLRFMSNDKDLVVQKQ